MIDNTLINAQSEINNYFMPIETLQKNYPRYSNNILIPHSIVGPTSIFELNKKRVSSDISKMVTTLNFNNFITNEGMDKNISKSTNKLLSDNNYKIDNFLNGNSYKQISNDEVERMFENLKHSKNKDKKKWMNYLKFILKLRKL